MLEKDDYRKTYNVHYNTVTTLYQACKPEILATPKHIVAVIQFLHDFIDAMIGRQDLDETSSQVEELLDRSVIADTETYKDIQEMKNSYGLIQSVTWDLSKIDFDQLQQQFKETPYKNIAIADMRSFLDKKIMSMLKQNGGRINFAERYQQIIDRYNSGVTTTEQLFEDLQQFTQNLNEEAQRHVRESLTEEELEIYDLLLKEKLTKAEEQRVKVAAKDLIYSLQHAQSKVLFKIGGKMHNCKLMYVIRLKKY